MGRTSIGLAALLCAAIVGCVDQVHDDAPEAGDVEAGPDAGPFACAGDVDAATAPVQASAEATACLHARCIDVSQCAEVTADRPVCVYEFNGGIMVGGFYACPPGCCY